jgi:multicomponent Na+:H+ antiporter subunit G
MNAVQNAITILLIFGGTFFMLVGSIGLNRMPDFYTRIHASGKVDTLGIMLFLSGMVVHEGLSLNSAKLLLIIAFVAFTSPVASHALSRRALQFGLKPWYGRKKKESGSNALDD